MMNNFNTGIKNDINVRMICVFILLALSLACVFTSLFSPAKAFGEPVAYPEFTKEITANGTTLESFSASLADTDGTDKVLVPQSYQENLAATYNVSFSLSGNNDHAPGSIVLEIPYDVYITKTKSYGTVDLQLLEAPAETEDYPYNYTIDKENNKIIITNYTTVPAAHQMSMAFVYRYSPSFSSGKLHSTLDIVGGAQYEIYSSLAINDAGIQATSNKVRLSVDSRAYIDDRLWISSCEDYSKFPIEAALNVSPPDNPEDYIYAMIHGYVYFDSVNFTQAARIIATLDTGTEHAFPIGSPFGKSVMMNGVPNFENFEGHPVLDVSTLGTGLSTSSTMQLSVAFIVAIDKQWISDSTEVDITYKMNVECISEDDGEVSSTANETTLTYMDLRDRPTGNLYSLSKYSNSNSEYVPSSQALLADVPYTTTWYNTFSANALNLTTPDGTMDFENPYQRFYTIDFVDDHIYLSDGTRLSSSDYEYDFFNTDGIIFYDVEYQWSGGTYKYIPIESLDSSRIKKYQVLVKIGESEDYIPLYDAVINDGGKGERPVRKLVPTQFAIDNEFEFSTYTSGGDIASFDNSSGLPVTGYKLSITTSYPAVSYGHHLDTSGTSNYYSGITFKPSETIKDFISSSPTSTVKIYNVNTLNISDDQGNLIGIKKDQGDQDIPSSFVDELYADDVDEFGVEMYHGTCTFDLKSENDIEYGLDKTLSTYENDSVNKQTKAKYNIKITESYNTAGNANGYVSNEFLDFLVDNRYTVRPDYRIYDLLPAGAFLDTERLSEIDADSDFDYTTIDQIQNYKGSGRTLVVMDCKAKNSENETLIISSEEGHASYNTVSLPIVYPYSSSADYGNILHNSVALHAKYGGFDEQGRGDDGGDISDADLFVDLEGDGPNVDENDYLYAETTDTIETPSLAELSLTKSVKTADSSFWSLSGDKISVPIGGDYSYRLHFGSSPDTTTTDMVLYDNLEQYGESGWHGILESVDATQPTRKGIAPVVYYTTESNVDFNAHPVDDSSIWTPQKPSDVSEIKGIAIDMRRTSDGSPAILEPEETVSVIVNMKAPSNADDITDIEVPAMNAVSLHSTISSIYDDQATNTALIEYDHTSIFMEGSVISVAKAVEGRDIDGYQYGFRLLDSSGNPIRSDTVIGGISEDGTFSLTPGETLKAIVPPGDYTVEETTTPDDIADTGNANKMIGTSYSIDGGASCEGSSASISVENGQETKINFTNSFQELTMSICIVDSETDAPLQGVPMSVFILNTGAIVSDSLISDEQGNTAAVECAADTYRIEQTSAISGYVLPKNPSLKATISQVNGRWTMSFSDNPALASPSTITADEHGNFVVKMKNVPAHPSLSLKKTATSVINESEAFAGEEVSYSFEIENTGNVPLNGVAIVDELEGVSQPAIDWSSSPDGTVLSPGEKVNGTASYRLTQDDIDRGKLENIAYAKGHDDCSGVDIMSDEATANTTICSRADISIEKTSSVNLIEGDDVAPGFTIIYGFTIENTGNATLTNVVIQDALPEIGNIDIDWNGSTDDKSSAGVLLPNEKVTATAEYKITQKDIDTGSIKNTATVTAKAPVSAGIEEVSSEDSVTTMIEGTPGISIDATVDKPEISGDSARAGTLLHYDFDVVNIGTVTLNSQSVLSSLMDKGLTNLLYDTGSLPEDGSFPPNASFKASADYALTQEDIDAGTVLNLASVTAQTSEGVKVEDEDDVDTIISADPSAVLIKTSDKETYENAEAGDVVEYGFTITNDGNVTLSHVCIEDDMDGLSSISYDWSNASGEAVLAPGETAVATASYTLKQEDIDRGSIVNTARIIGAARGGDPCIVSEDAESTARIEAVSSLAFVKKADAATIEQAAEGDEITYSFSIANTGATTITQVEIQDDLIGLSKISYDWSEVNEDGTLLPGEHVSATATYSINANDLSNGEVVNNAIANGTDLLGREISSEPSSATVKIVPAEHEKALMRQQQQMPADSEDDTVLSKTGGAELLVSSLLPVLLLSACAAFFIYVKRRSRK